MSYAYAESTVVVGPLSPVPHPHSWDLCAKHAAKIKPPVGWELSRVGDVDIENYDDDDLTELMEAVRMAQAAHDLSEAKAAQSSPQHTSARVQPQPDPRFVPNHPVYRKQHRRGHLHVVPDVPKH